MLINSPDLANMKGEISIQEVLARLRDVDSEEGTFLLKFVRSTGKNRGNIKIIPKASYGGSYKRRTAKKQRPNRYKNQHKNKGTIPITDTETGQYLTPLISHIIQYNQYKVRH